MLSNLLHSPTEDPEGNDLRVEYLMASGTIVFES
jgi:hypothetical protein